MLSASPSAIRRLCLAVDVESYSGRSRAQQLDVQNRLLWMMAQACQAGGVNPARCDRQDSGDGQILILPGGINEAAVLPNTVLGLLTALNRVNNPAGSGGRIRLRVSIGQGAIQLGATGFVAPAVVTVCRLLESSELRAALSANQSCDAACIVTADLYDDMFVQGYGGLPARGFTSVHISQPAKNFAADAWIQVPAQLPLLAAVPAYPDVTELERKQWSKGGLMLDLGVAGGLAWALFAATKRGAPIPGVHIPAPDQHHAPPDHTAGGSADHHASPDHEAADFSESEHSEPDHLASEDATHDSNALWHNGNSDTDNGYASYDTTDYPADYGPTDYGPTDYGDLDGGSWGTPDHGFLF